MRQGDKYLLRESDDVLARENAIHGDIDLRLSLVEDLAEAFRAGNRGDIDALIKAYNTQIATAAAQIADVLEFLEDGNLTADVVEETTARRFLTDERRQDIILEAVSSVVGGASPLRDTLSELSSAIDAVQAGVAAITAGAPANRDTLLELSAAIDTVQTALTSLGTSTSDALAKRVRFDAAQTLSLAEKTQAKSNLGIAASDVIASRLVVTANYTVAAADRGKVIVCSGGSNFTLTTIAAATAGSGFYFWVQKVDGSGVVTLDPNGAETIASLASIKIYQEAFLVWTDGTAWYTQNRQRGWISLGGVTLTAQTLAAISFTTGFLDPELLEINVRIENLTKSASAAHNLRVIKGGSPAQGNTYSIRSTLYAGNVLTSGTVGIAGPASPANTTGPDVVDVTLKNNLSSVASDQLFEYSTASSTAFGSVIVGHATETSAGQIGGFYLAPASGTFTALTYKMKGFRP